MRPRLLFGCLTALASALPAAEPTEPVDPEPSAAETMILELINRFRADPAAEAARIAPEGGNPNGIPGDVDLAMFRSEMRALAPAQPLVFNLDLLAAARKHSRYMILHGLGHDEDPGKAGFTGRTPSDRVRAVGYQGGSAENCYRDPRDPWSSQVGFLVDWGAGGAGGMQPERGHRRNEANPAYREIGAGAVPFEGRISVTHNLGGGSASRYAGGVVYVDLDGDGFYTPGEGRGGVAITASDGRKTVTWASGAYTLELAGSKPVQLVAAANGQSSKAAFPAGSENLKFDWIIPRELDLAVADKLIADAEKAPEATRFKALVALQVGAARLFLDPPRTQRVAALTGTIGADLESARRTVRAAIGTADFRKTVTELAKPFRATVAGAWFKGAESVHAAQGGVAGFEQQAAAKAPPAKQVRDLVGQLEQARDALDDGDLRARMQALLERVQQAAKTGGAAK